jgi:hypothetical protein
VSSLSGFLSISLSFPAHIRAKPPATQSLRPRPTMPHRSPSDLRCSPTNQIPQRRWNIGAPIILPCANPSSASPTAQRRRWPCPVALGPLLGMSALSPLLRTSARPPLFLSCNDTLHRRHGRGYATSRWQRDRGSPRLWPAQGCQRRTHLWSLLRAKATTVAEARRTGSGAAMTGMQRNQCRGPDTVTLCLFS